MEVLVDCRKTTELECQSCEGYHVPTGLDDATSKVGVPSARRLNPYTGTAAYLTAPETHNRSESVLARAMAHVSACLPELTGKEHTKASFLADPHVVTTGAGEQIVYLQQHIHGVPVFRAQRAVRFDREGAIVDIVGDHVADPPDDVDLIPTLDAAGAVLAAAQHLAAPEGHDEKGLKGLEVSNRRPRVVGRSPLAAAPTLVRKPPFASPILATLLLFYERPRLRLAWHLPLRLPRLVAQFDLIVAANGPEAGEILLCQDGMASAITARATFFNPDLVPAKLQSMPQPAQAFPPFQPRPLPGPWVSRNKTAGNNAVASWGSRGKRPRAGKGPEGLVFEPEAGSPEAAAVNGFFLCNFLHDFFYLLGFDERAGALQTTNPAGVEGAGDELDLRVRSSVTGAARAETQADGDTVRLFLGLVEGADGISRQTAFDAEVVIHEYTHAVTARRIGGKGLWKPLLGGPPQAQAIEEGMSDYYALTLQSFLRRQHGLEESLVYGAWSAGNPSTGVRPASYLGFTGPFSLLGSSEEFTDPHGAGMVWCAALLEMNRRFAENLGSRDLGDLAGWLLVFDAMPLFPVGQHSPSFLDGRDALVRTALSWQAATPEIAAGPLGTSGQVDQLEVAVREAFAVLGMGRDAVSPGDGGFDAIQDNFDL